MSASPRLALVISRFWPLSRRSLPAWLSVMSTLVSLFLRAFILRLQNNAFKRAHVDKCKATLATMDVIQKFVQEKDKAAKTDKAEDKASKTEAQAEEQAEEQKSKEDMPDYLPEASRIFKLLWDEVYECRTTCYGFDATDLRNRSTEELMKRVTACELEKAIRLTRRSRQSSVEASSLDESRELAEHRSGEVLEDTIRFARDSVRKHLGRDFVDSRLLEQAKELLRAVRRDQQRNLAMLSQLVLPVAPQVLLVVGLSSLRETLRAIFHQIRAWAIPIEAAVDGKWHYVSSNLVWIFCGHMLIDCLDMLGAGYKNRATAELSQKIRNAVMKAVMQQDYEFFDRNEPNILQERVNSDAGGLAWNLVNLPNDMLSSAVGIVCNVYGAKVQISNKLFFTAVSPLLPIILCQRRLMELKSRMNEKERKIDERVYSNSGEVLRQIRTVRQFAMERREIDLFERTNDLRDEMSERSVVFTGVMNLLFGITIYGGLISTLYLGASDVVAGRLSVAQLLDVMFKLNFNVVFPTRGLIAKLPQIFDLRAPLGRVCDVLDSNPRIEPKVAEDPRVKVWSSRELEGILEVCEEVVEGPFSDRRVIVGSEGLGQSVPPGSQLVTLSCGDTVVSVDEKASIHPHELSYPLELSFCEKVRPGRFHGLIEFNNVHFAYPTNPQKPVLKGVSFTVEPGQKVAIVGATGCGKSSIMSLLQRLYQPQKGSIRVDGRPIEDYDVNVLRSRMVIVDQNTVLWATTLQDNITYGVAKAVTSEEVEQACREACAWSFIDAKPDKLMTDVSIGGLNLSGGERQRVAIARAMVRQPDVILLDEATSALDTKNERIVQEALDKLARQGSALVIAHRLSTIQDSDRIVVMDQGAKVEEGTHDDLLRRPPKEDLEPRHHSGWTTPPAERSNGEVAVSRDKAPGMLHLRRQSSAPPSVQQQPTDGSNGSGKDVSYRSMWESSTGTEKMTVQQMEKKIGELEGELSSLKTRMGKIRMHLSQALKDGAPASTAAPAPEQMQRWCSA